MQKKNSALSTRFPWWLSIILAAACYYSLKYLLPDLVPENSPMYPLSQAGPSVAPIITIIFLLLGAKRLYDPVPDAEKPAEEDVDNNKPKSDLDK